MYYVLQIKQTKRPYNVGSKYTFLVLTVPKQALNWVMNFVTKRLLSGLRSRSKRSLTWTRKNTNIPGLAQFRYWLRKTAAWHIILVLSYMTTSASGPWCPHLRLQTGSSQIASQYKINRMQSFSDEHTCLLFNSSRQVGPYAHQLSSHATSAARSCPVLHTLHSGLRRSISSNRSGSQYPGYGHKSGGHVNIILTIRTCLVSCRGSISIVGSLITSAASNADKM